jgi:hypothetical protein
MSLAQYPGAYDDTNPYLRQAIIDFEDRTNTSLPTDYVVTSEDIKVLQDIVLAIETALGINPAGLSENLVARIEAIESTSTLDDRYGGVDWVGAGSPTILGHDHSTNQINLTSDVTGELPKTNIQLTGAGALSAGDILVSTAGTKTIAVALTEKFDKSGGVIAGNTTITGHMNSYMFKDVDAKDLSYTTGNNVVDTATFCGTSRVGLGDSDGDASGNLITYSTTLRYFGYTLAIRLKVSDITQIDAIAQLTITSGSTVVLTYDIVPENFAANDTYEIIYVPFNHVYDGTATPTNVTINIEWYGSGAITPIDCDLSVDSLIITPLQNAVYWTT